MLRNVKDYRRPTSVEEAVALVHSNVNATYIGGGAWTVAQGDPTLEMVVDLQETGLNVLESSDQGLRIGATVTLQAIIDDANAGTFANGILATAAGYTQSRNLREQGTLGGTLIVAGSEDPLTTALLVLDANIHYADPTTHTAPFMSFVAYRNRLIKTNALLTELNIKPPMPRSATAFEVVGRSPKDKPIVCAAAHIAVAEGLASVVRIAVGGADANPTRLHKAEHLLRGQLVTEARIAHAMEPSLAELHPIADFRGSVEYRLEMVKVLVKRAMLGAWAKARGA